jgi:signal transduction histidine kinase
MSFHAQTREPSRPEAWIGQATVVCRAGDRIVPGVLEQPAAPAAPDGDLKRRYRALQGAYEGRGLAMAIAGHDLRQPLQVIGMVLARLAARSGDERDLSWLDIANGEIARLSAGLDDLAVLSRDDEGANGGPTLGDVCVDRVLQDAASTWRHHARAKGLKLSVVPSGLTVRSNARLLSVIVGNLVSNAIKYTEAGGVVLGCRRRGGRVTIEVVDTGRGFSDASDAVFSPFWREDSDNAGLGLGLSIVRHTAEILGHAVMIRSKRGAGSRVGVIIERGAPLA